MNSFIILKGQCHKIFWPCFFHQATSPSPTRHAFSRKDFEFFEYLGSYLYSLLIPQCIHHWESRLPVVSTYMESWFTGVFITVKSRLPSHEYIGELTYLVLQKKAAGAKYIRESRLPFYLLPGLFVTRSLFVNIVWCLFQMYQEVNSPVYSPQVSWDSPVFSSPVSRVGHRGIVSPILIIIPQSLQGFTF